MFAKKFLSQWQQAAADAAETRTRAEAVSPESLSLPGLEVKSTLKAGLRPWRNFTYFGQQCQSDTTDELCPM